MTNEERAREVAADYDLHCEAIDDPDIATLEDMIAAAINDAVREAMEKARVEFAILSRACGNWREWPDGAVSKDTPDYAHSDWKAAARAILERNELREAAQWVIEWEQDYRKLNNLGNNPPMVFIHLMKALRARAGEPCQER
jgi:hypothetical protein